jgi:hypothetical protein
MTDRSDPPAAAARPRNDGKQTRTPQSSTGYVFKKRQKNSRKLVFV